jgi:hypothetical protein
VPGGGTVSYVSRFEHTYHPDPTHREEGGTPAIIGAIRAGLVFHLKRAVGAENIEALEGDFAARAIARWSQNPNIKILGNLRARRLAIVSFVVRHGQHRLLHHNFVVALLNDLFGIQARGGCACAGPYGHRLLGIDVARSRQFHEAIKAGAEGIKPGWIRVNFNYFISEETFDYILEAVDLLAREGWRLLPQYRFDPGTGIWRHCNAPKRRPFRLADIAYRAGRMEYPSHQIREPQSALADYLVAARKILDAARSGEVMDPCVIQDSTPALTRLDDRLEPLRWFPLPGEL